MTTFIAKMATPGNGLLEFYFASIQTIHGEKYFVTIIDKETKSHVFYMKKTGGFWRIDTSVHKVQKRLLDLEYNLAMLIQQKG
jgi:hypothetical protein